MRERLRNFMYGRRGMDSLNKCLAIGGAVLVLLSVGAGMLGIGWLNSLFSIFGFMFLIYALIRGFSRNISARDAENYAYLNYLARRKNERQAAKERRAQKDYKFFKCPGCNQWLRVPKGKGKIHINCKCGYILYRKT